MDAYKYLVVGLIAAVVVLIIGAVMACLNHPEEAHQIIYTALAAVAALIAVIANISKPKTPPRNRNNLGAR